jgi:integrase
VGSTARARPTAAITDMLRGSPKRRPPVTGLIVQTGRRTVVGMLRVPSEDEDVKVKLPKGTGPHALRHDHASLLIAAGESVKVVSERLGHTNAAMTLNVYSHLFPESEERTRAAVDRAFGALAEECAPDVPSQSDG